MKKLLFLFLIGTSISACSSLFYDGFEEKKVDDNVFELASPNSISIELPNQTDYLYQGIENIIKVHVPEGNTHDYEVIVNTGSIVKEDPENGLYYYYENQVKGVAVDIMIQHTFLNRKYAKIFQLVPIPAPSSYLWKYRVPLPMNKDELNRTVDHQQINALILDMNNSSILSLCSAISYQVEYIPKEGPRRQFINQIETGMFSDSLIKSIRESSNGDLYIFDQIQSNCSDAYIQPVVLRISQ